MITVPSDESLDKPPLLGDPEQPPTFPPPSGAPVVAPAPGVAARPRWERPALAVLLIGTGVLYVWSLSESGWANSFYAAAAQAGSKSWKAWFFGSSDSGNSITVDKPPAALWIDGLSVRLFGLNSWSVLVPQALLGVATVGVVYAGVRRWFSVHAALLAGAVLALTPVATLMFRFNNPDALLVLLITLAAYFTLRGIEDGRRRWVVLTGVAIGFGFLAKQLQVLLVVPPLTFAYLIAAKPKFGRRIVDVLIAGGAMILSAGWWVAVVTLWPASSRPYIGGSQHNSILELTFGYNGFGRLTGDEVGSVGGRVNQPSGMWGPTGITRMFDGVSGGQIAWLIPAALAAIVSVLWITRRRRRTDMTRAAVLVWGGWLVCTGLVFSFMHGIYHDYYTVALAPPIAALVGIGGHVLWSHRDRLEARVAMAFTLVLTGWWSATLLGRAGDWHAWLGTVVVVAAIGGAVLILIGRDVRIFAVGALAAVVALLAGPTAFAAQTASVAHTGAIVTAGPPVRANTGGRGGPFFGQLPTIGRNGNAPGGRNGNVPGGTQTGGNQTGGRNRNGAGTGGGSPTGGGFPGAGGGGGFPGGGVFPGAGGGGGLLDSGAVSQTVIDALRQDAGTYRWVAAAIGSNRAAGYQLAADEPVMPVGGFNGSDPSPTLAEFQAFVAAGQVHYFIAGGTFGQGMGGSQDAERIAQWVASRYLPVSIGGATLYDLTT